MDRKDNCLYQFGPFHLDAAERLLLRDKQRVHLAQKDFELLLLLIQNAGHILEKEELLKNLWPDAFVEEGNLNRHISTLRKKLGAGYDETQYIETIPRIGYRFTANVETSCDEKAQPDSIAARTRSKQTEVGPTSIDSVAVLPFENVGRDESAEYLADGITDSIINSLSRLPQLRVMARVTVSRYKGAEIDPQKVAMEIGVRAVVVGKLLQLGEKLIVKVELVDATDGAQLWGEQYSRTLSDLFEVQEDISHRISQMLRLQLTAEQKRHLSERYTNNTEAYQQYLMGRFLFNKRTPDGLRKGLKHYERAIELDPKFALAYVGITESYMYLGFYGLLQRDDFLPRATKMAARALELDPHLAEAHIAMAHIKRLQLDWAGMEEEYQAAIRINSILPEVHRLYSVLLRQLGRFDESFAEIRKAQDLNQISPNLITTAAANLYCARHYDQALIEILKVIELEPAMPSAHLVAGWIYTQQKKYREAIEAFQKAATLFEDDQPEIKANLACAYALWGKKKRAKQLLVELMVQSSEDEPDHYHIAVVYASLGETHQAFGFLEKAWELRSPELSYLKVDPLLDSLRSDPRFPALLRQCGFTAGPASAG
jgi:TolB-like protein/Tfp pilus assembly protein PilF